MNDWKWDIEEKKLEKIPPIPGYGRVNFGIAANNGEKNILIFCSIWLLFINRKNGCYWRKYHNK